jgi:NADH-quinone oxidoreductase subunit N
MFNAPSLNYVLLAPMLITLGAALIGVLIEAFAPLRSRRTLQLTVTLLALLAAFIQAIQVRNKPSISAAVTSVVMDKAGIFLQMAIFGIAILAVLLIADQENFTAAASTVPGSLEENSAFQSGGQHTEIYPLTLFAVSGMALFTVASDLITLFVALEVLSLPLYLMAGLSRRRRLLSQEAAMKYFLLGAFASAIFLFGAAFIYGYSGSLNLSAIATSLQASNNNVVFLLIGTALLAVGLLFKLGVVPFHAWVPDVYQGSPTPITAFMAACTKIAAVGATLRIFYVAFTASAWSWKPVLTVIAIITMLGGAIATILQRDVKRALAYSSITHAGFLLIGVVALNQVGLAATLFYLVTYGLATVGIFGIVTLVRDSSGEVTDLNRWVGLGRKSPVFAAIFSLFLLSFGGVPLTAGFVGKFTIFTAAYAGGNTAIVVAGAIASAIALFFYFRVVIMFFFAEPTNSAVSVVIPSSMTRLAIALPALATVVLGIYPPLLFNFIEKFSLFLR